VPETARLLGLVFSLDEGQMESLNCGWSGQPSSDAEIVLDVSRADVPGVRCRLVCSQSGSDFGTADLAAYWQALLESDTKLDHWVLISPRADPDEGLRRFLASGKAQQHYGCEIQVWSSATGVADLFGLEPGLYERFFKPESGEPHPCDWDDPRRRKIVESFRSRLPPLLSLPDGWDDYLRDPSFLCVSGNERDEFDAAYGDRAPLSLNDASGAPLPGPAEQRLIRDWLNAPDAPRVCLLLAEFGDGKSFLTYVLARELIRHFQDNPREGTLPLRRADENPLRVRQITDPIFVPRS
jgi:hypothetical protein